MKNIRRKRLATAILVFISMLTLMTACSHKEDTAVLSESEVMEKEMNENSDAKPSDEGEKGTDAMKLIISGTEVPIVWEDNRSVNALKELGDTEIQMSMYGGNEQVGPIGQTLPSDDVQTTTRAGDVVLYSSNQIVVFYGSNTWAYTRLGHIDMSEEEMTDLLGNGDVTLRIIN